MHYAYLKDALARLPTQSAGRLEDLLPHRWQPAIAIWAVACGPGGVITARLQLSFELVGNL